MKRAGSKGRFRLVFLRGVYFVLYVLVRLFIAIGDSTRFLILAPFRASTLAGAHLQKILRFTATQVLRAFSHQSRHFYHFIASLHKRSFSLSINLRSLFSKLTPRRKKRVFVKTRKIVLTKFSFPKFSFPRWPKIKFPQFLFKIRKPKARVNRAPKPLGKRVPSTFVLGIKIKYFVIGFALAGATVFAYQSYSLVKSLPSPRNIGKVNYSLSSHIYDRNGRLLYEIYREQNRTPVKLANLKPYVYHASIAIEDKEFFNHKGISVINGIVRAAHQTIIKKNLQGGSTITQQLVKSALLTPERTIERKVKEIILALWAERLYSKEQILELYLNQVPYGGSSYGIEEASRTYFGKSSRDLDIAEAALLAGLPQAPSVYSPFTNPRYTIARRNDVLEKMYEQDYIDSQTYKRESSKALSIIPPKTTIHAPHFVFYIKSQLEREFSIRTVEEGGLRVASTLDLTIQQEAEKILHDELEKIAHLRVTNGAILVTRPSTGEILAMVGSADYFAAPSGAFNVTTALRQPGSSIKPLMYSLALERGFTAATILQDAPVTFAIGPTEVYRPVNYDGKFHGRVPLRLALANSYNIPAVRTLNAVGVDEFVKHAKSLGISTWDDSSRFGLSLTLGGGEVTMIDMARAYGVLANLGQKVDTTSMITVKNISDDAIFEKDTSQERVMPSGVAYILSDILSDNAARAQAFGARSALEIPDHRVAVKTGTTDDKKDNWTIGYTPDFLVLVWVGNNDNTPMHPYLTSGITGAAPIWNKMMTYLVANYGAKNNWYQKPDDVVEKQCLGRREYFLAGTENTVSCAPLPVTTPTPVKTAAN